MTKIAALYCRLSPRPDGSYEGVEVQERQGRAYAAKTWPGQPVEVYADAGISAANGDHRPEFERFRQDVRDGRVEHVWVVEQSRLERSEVGWFELAAELDAAGIGEVHTTRDGIVEVRGLSSGIKAVVNAEEVRRITRRVNDKLADNAGQGYPPPVTPFGYRRAVNAEGKPTLVIVDDQAAAVRFAAEKILAGWSLTNVAAELRARGVVGRSGGTVNATTVRTWLTSRTLTGARVHRGELVGRGNWPAIIDADTFRAVGAKLAAPRTVSTRGGRSVEITAGHLQNRPGQVRRYWLTGGLSVCGICGKPMAGAVTKLGKRGKPKPRLKCRTGHASLPMIVAEDHVLDRLWAELDKPEFLGELADGTTADRRAEVSTVLDALEAQRRELAELWAAGDLTTIDWSTARRGLDEREVDLQRELAELPAAEVDVDQARDAWPVMTLDERRAFVRIFVERVTVHGAANGSRLALDERVEIQWRRV